MKNSKQVDEKNNNCKENMLDNKTGKNVTKFKSNPKIDNKRNLNLNLLKKWNSSSNIIKSSSETKVANKNISSALRDNLNDTNSFYKNNENSKTKNIQSKLIKESEEKNNKDSNCTSHNNKANNFTSKHKRAYSDFSTPSPIIKNKPVSFAANNFKESNSNLMNSNTCKAYENSRGKINNSSKNRLYLGNHTNINSEKNLNKGKLKIFESDNFKNKNNTNSINQRNQIIFSNLNSKEENQTIQRDDEIRNSNNCDSNIMNKNIINYDLMYKNIPVFENIEAKHKLLKQNSIDNLELNKDISLNEKDKVNHFNKSEVFISPKKINSKTCKDISNLQSKDYRGSNSNTLEEPVIDFNKTINKHEYIALNAAYANFDVKNLGKEVPNSKMINSINKLDIPNLDNYINSPSTNIINKEISMNLLKDTKENKEISDNKTNQDLTKSFKDNDTKGNKNDTSANDLTIKKNYKIIDTVHLNKFLNNRSNNLNVNSVNLKTKTTTIANFVSIYNQENLKINLKKYETSSSNKNNNSSKLSSQNSKVNQINGTPIKAMPEVIFDKETSNQGSVEQSYFKLNENKDEKFLFKTVFVDPSNKSSNTHVNKEINYGDDIKENKEKTISFNKLAAFDKSYSIQNIKSNINRNLLANSCDLNNFNKNFNPNNFKNKVFFSGSNNSNINNFSNKTNDKNINENNNSQSKNKNENYQQKFKMKKSESSNFNSKTTKLNENSSIENGLQITADDFSKRSNDNASSNQLKNSFNNFALSNLINNDHSAKKSSNDSKINLHSINSKNKDSFTPFKVENNFSSINNSKITANTLNSMSNNSNNNNKNSNISNISKNNCKNYINKEGIADADHLLVKKMCNHNVNNFNKNNTKNINLNPYYKGNSKTNYENDNFNKNIDQIDKKKCSEDKEENDPKIRKSLNNMHKKTKSMDFNSSKEKYSTKFINTNQNYNLNSNKNTFNRKENNENSNKNFIPVNLLNSNNNRNAIAISASNNNISNIIDKEHTNVFISTKISNKANILNNNNLNPKHRKNSYSHAFISHVGNHQNNNAINIRNSQNNPNKANFNNYNNQAKVKVATKIENKEKEKIILNFSSNNSSNLNFNNLSKNLNENNNNNNNLIISPFGHTQRNINSQSNPEIINKLKGNTYDNNFIIKK